VRVAKNSPLNRWDDEAEDRTTLYRVYYTLLLTQLSLNDAARYPERSDDVDNPSDAMTRNQTR